MANFFQMVVPQYFGVGAAKEVGDKLKTLGCTKALVIYDKGVESSGVPANIVEYIKQAGIEVVTNNEGESDPSDTLVKKLTEIGKAEKVNSIVAIGGGSSMDAGKAVKLLLNNEGTLEDYYDLTRPHKGAGVTMIAIPTTSGTGSECSKGAVITDTASGSKKTLIGFGTIPDISIVDPELTLGVPKSVTASCAFDVLAHAIDGATSNMTTPACQAMSYEAIRLFAGSFKQAYDNGQDLEARTQMHIAANIGGLALANGKATMCHAFAHSMGAVYHIPHGVCCAVFTPACLEFIADLFPEQMRRFAEILKVPYTDADKPTKIARDIGELIYKMYRSVDIKNIKELIPDKADACAKIIPLAFTDAMATFSARKLDDESAQWIMDRTYEMAELG